MKDTGVGQENSSSPEEEEEDYYDNPYVDVSPEEREEMEELQPASNEASTDMEMN